MHTSGGKDGGFDSFSLSDREAGEAIGLSSLDSGSFSALSSGSAISSNTSAAIEYKVKIFLTPARSYLFLPTTPLRVESRGEVFLSCVFKTRQQIIILFVFLPKLVKTSYKRTKKSQI